ncbi:MAG: antibiotic ABC transporter ATP-binding protein [Bacteroidetes bacterium RIFCSPLOWO2_12_FULL_35_15]|nr:MAG: antibiotic ABC transporter ATP-binding protein [Bacteroidetes bacterium RIFCSPLOWO2_12_FULL_35_15]
MKKFFGVLHYVKGYWRFAIWNIIFNILSVLFSLFSFAMLIPFLKILFSDNPAELEGIVRSGEPVFGFSTDKIVATINYFLAKGAVDYGKINVLFWICIFVIVTIFLKNLFRYFAMFFLAPIRNGVIRDLRNKLFDKTLNLPLSYYSEERKGDIMSRMTADVQEIEWSIMQSLEMIFREPLTIAIYMILMLVVSAKLTIIALVLLPVTALLIGSIGKSLKRSASSGKAKMGILLSMMEETLGGLRIIKGFNAEKNVSGKFQKENQLYTNISIKMYRKVDLASPLSEFLGVSVLVVILFLGGEMVLSNKSMDGALLIFYLVMFYQLLTPAKSFTTAYYSVQKGLASSERIDSILNAEIKIQDASDPKSISKFEKEIEYRNVSFAYREAELGWVLKNINLKIEKGKTIALVGQSGSGKTTLADMLPRFYDPTEGEILIDGTVIKDAKIKDVRSLMGIVTQESILFNDTVYNNIAFGIENVTEQQVIEAAKIANAHEFISQMPEAYQTNIGDRGSKLSGGQRQRISIARAVLKNPPVLILDEATSALDTESERLVQDALNKLMKNRTSLVIAHRLSTIQHADEIIVMQKGEIIERGTHTTLLAQNGTYRKLNDMQSFV